MKKMLQGLITGVLIGTMLTSGVVFAKNIQETINAVYMNVKLVIDGEEITPKDVNGNIVEPFIYNGTTYLPVRSIGEAFDKDVYWDGETATVYVGDIVKPAKEVSLYDKPYIECGKSSEFVSGKSKDFTYLKNVSVKYIGFKFNPSLGYERNEENKRCYFKNYVIYPLNGLTKKVKGTFMPTHDFGAAEYQFNFYNESGKMLYQSPIMTNSTAPIDFEFEAKNALNLKIECVANDSGCYGPNCTINNITILTTDYQ